MATRTHAMRWSRWQALALLAGMLGAPALAVAQARVVTGRITDSLGNPVPLVHVYISTRGGEPGGPDGTLSDANGRYRLRLAGGDSIFVAIRRIGFTRQSAKRVGFGDRESIELNWVLAAVPQVLAAVHVTPGACRPITQFADGHPVRELWDGAVAGIRARQAFLDLYQYEEHVIRKDAKLGQSAQVTMDSTNVVTPPQPDLQLGFRDEPLGKILIDAQRRRTTSLWAPTDRALVDSVFVSRFCFEDGIVETADKYTQLSFRETGRGRTDVVAKGTLRFRQDVPGIAVVLFSYEVGANVIGRGSVSFSLIPVEGTAFPLETAAFLEILDASGRAVTSRATTSHEYAKFMRIVKQ